MNNHPCTPRLKKSLAMALKIAKKLNHSYIGPEHVMLTFLEKDFGGKIESLMNFSFNEKSKERIREFLEGKIDL